MTLPPLLMLTDVRRRRGGRRVRLWLPLVLLWILLLPVALLLAPAIVVACLVFRCDPLAGTQAVFGLLCNLSGTSIEVDTPDTLVFIRFV